MSTMTMHRRPVTATRLLVALVAVLLVAVGAVATPHRALADTAGLGGDFVPLTGSHILLDTRNGTGATKGTRAAGSVTVFTIAGAAGVPATGVKAVLVSLIAVATGNTYLMAYPDGSARPNPGSMVNASSSQDMANMAVIPLGSNGKADVYTYTASDIVVEAEGYFTTTTGTTGGGFVPITAKRVVDTRDGTGGVTKAKIPANGSITATVATGSPIPTTAGSVMVNVTVLASSTGWVGVFPGGTTTGNSAVDYMSGSVASTAVTKLGSGGKVTIANKGGTAVDVILDAEGYFTTTPSTGAGLRLVPAVRLLDTGSATVASGATVDVQVGGTHALPTTDIAGALLNLTVTGASGGYVTAWPVGETEPSPYSFTAFPANVARADLVAVKAGTEGKVRIRNHTAGAIRVIVDLQGWFEDPLPAVAPASYSPTQAVQGLPASGATVGALEYAYVDNIGRVVYGHQPDPSNASNVQWTVISGNEAYSGPPALAKQANGRLELAAQHGDSNVWSALQASGSTTWGAWANNGGSMASPPVVGVQTDGSLVLFAVDGSGELWDLPQAGANGAFGSWHPLGVTGLTGSLGLATVQTGLALVALDTSGALRTATLSTANTLSAWTSLGGSGLTGTPAVVVYPGYRLRVFARGGDGVIVTKAQDASGVWPADFSSVGTLAVAGSPSAVLSPASGKTEIVARGSDGNVYSTGETTQGSGVWRDWVGVLVGSDTAATDPTAFDFNPGTGLAWAFVIRNADNQSLLYTVDTSGLSAAAAAKAAPAFHQKAVAAAPR
jgi:hypothetical protein